MTQVFKDMDECNGFLEIDGLARMLVSSSGRRVRGLRIRSDGDARQMLPSTFACLESLDSDNGLLNFQNHFSGTYGRFDIHEALLEHELKVLLICSRIHHFMFYCYLKSTGLIGSCVPFFSGF